MTDNPPGFLDHPTGNPYPFYERLGSTGAVQWIEQSQNWVILGYSAARQVLTDTTFLIGDAHSSLVERLAVAARCDFSSLQHMLRTMPVFLNPPTHGTARRLLAKALAHRPAGEIRGFTLELVDRLIEKIRIQGGFDLMRDFASRIPAAVVAHILGIPQEDEFELTRNSRIIIEAFDLIVPLPLRSFQRINRAAGEMIDYFSGQVAQRRRAPREDGLSYMLKLAAEGGVADEDVVGFCVFLVMAGSETTANFICGGGVTLFETPHLVEELHASAHDVPAAAEELLRQFSPIQGVARVATVDRIVGGKKIAAGDSVSVMLGAANRDPDIYPNGKCPVLRRSGPVHLAFGAGAHVCLGGPLARMEGAVAFSALLTLQNPRIQFDGIVWSQRHVTRGLQEVPVLL